MGTIAGGIIGGIGSLVGAGISSGAASDSSAAQLQGNREAREQIQQNVDRARQDALALFGQAQGNERLGFSESLGLQGQTIPEQGRLLQQGNVAAQNQLLAGLPQIQNAILGNQIDLSGLQPTQLNADFNIFNRQLPDFGTISDLNIDGDFGGLFNQPNPQNPPAVSPIDDVPSAQALFPNIDNRPLPFDLLGGAGLGFGGNAFSGNPFALGLETPQQGTASNALVPFNFGLSPVTQAEERAAFGNLFNARR